jgi:hypothetical protein
MNTTAGRLSQLQRQRDEAKRQLDEVSSQRDSLRFQQQRLIDETYYVESVLQSALGRGDLDGVRNAKARLAEIRRQRDDCFDMISALSIRHQLLQGDYGRAFDNFRHAEGEAEFLARRIPELRQRLATARRREGNFSPIVNVDDNSSAIIGAELQKCEDKYFALTGEQVPEQFPTAA